MSHKKHIHRLAALIAEDVNEYAGLEDNDEFQQPGPSGYGCGSGCWEYEEFPFNIDGQPLFGTASINYHANITKHKGYRQTHYEPGEPDWAEVSIGDHTVDFVLIFTDNGDVIARWHREAGKKWYDVAYGTQTWDAGFQEGSLTDDQLRDVINQISQQFIADVEQVEEYERENSFEDYGPDSG